MKTFWANANFITYIRKKFQLEDVPRNDNPMLFQPVIIGTTNMDNAVSLDVSASANSNLTAAAGTYVPMHTVPQGERWTLLYAHRAGTTATTRIRVAINGAIGTDFSNTTNAESEVPLFALRLIPKDSIGMLTTGNGADNSVNLTIYYTKEAYESPT